MEISLEHRKLAYAVCVPQFALAVFRASPFTRWFIFSLFGLSLLASHVSVNAQEILDSQSEYEAKAASLCAIGRYVKWPDSVFSQEQSPFVIGIFGKNPFGNALEQIAQKKTIQGRPILVQEYASLRAYKPCQILFVTRSTHPRVEARLLKKLQGRPVLLVGETAGFATRGGAINFFIDENDVRFELNPDQALKSQLRLNAKMHNLGTDVSSVQ